MNTTESNSDQPNKLIKQLSWIEAFLLICLIIGVILTSLNINQPILTYLGLGGLGIIYFIYAFRFIVDVPFNRETDKFGFNEMLAWNIVPRVAFISCAIGVIGILLYLLDRPGSLNLIMISSTSLTIAYLIWGFLKISGVKYYSKLIPIFMRSIPILLICIYLFVSG